MQWYHITLLVMALIAALTAWRVPNAVVWVGSGVCLAVTTSLAHISGTTMALAYGAVTNLIMCILIHAFAKNTWETRLMQAFILMLALDFLFAIGVIETQYLFAVSLEIVNAYALLLIFATGVLDRVARHEDADSRRYLHLLGSVYHALFGTPAPYPKWWRNP